MTIVSQDNRITVDGKSIDLGMHPDETLIRAVIISLFTWRRANPDDPLPSIDKFGWWGDNFPSVLNDRIGSRLWLLSREKLTAATVNRAREYAKEAVQWLTVDGVAARVDVEAERQGIDRIALACRVYRKAPTGAVLDLRFSDLWSFLNVV